MVDRWAFGLGGKIFRKFDDGHGCTIWTRRTTKITLYCFGRTNGKSWQNSGVQQKLIVEIKKRLTGCFSKFDRGASSYKHKISSHLSAFRNNTHECSSPLHIMHSVYVQIFSHMCVPQHSWDVRPSWLKVKANQILKRGSMRPSAILAIFGTHVAADRCTTQKNWLCNKCKHVCV